MIGALGTNGRAALAECARRGGLLAFDFDGTLAPLVADPGRAALRPETRRLLTRLAARQACLVLSGREPADLARRLHGIPLIECVGNHGAGFGQGPKARAAAVARAARWRERLAEQIAGRPGLQLEDNGVSLAVHYRRAPDRPSARRAIRCAVEALPGAHAMDGKCVVNVLPAASAHKGAVLRAIARARGARHVLYVGDDLTDETAFRTAVAPHYVTVRVGRGGPSAANFRLAGQSQIDELLRVLLGSP